MLAQTNSQEESKRIEQTPVGSKSIRQVVYSNRKSLELKNKKESEVCTICIEELKDDTCASIDCCDHKFCFGCVNSWAEQASNTCPNCKKKFN